MPDLSLVLYWERDTKIYTRNDSNIVTCGGVSVNFEGVFVVRKEEITMKWFV
jgi:hypothetical protein